MAATPANPKEVIVIRSDGSVSHRAATPQEQARASAPTTPPPKSSSGGSGSTSKQAQKIETKPIGSMTLEQAKEQGYSYSGAVGYFKETPVSQTQSPQVQPSKKIETPIQKGLAAPKILDTNFISVTVPKMNTELKPSSLPADISKTPSPKELPVEKNIFVSELERKAGKVESSLGRAYGSYKKDIENIAPKEDKMTATLTREYGSTWTKDMQKNIMESENVPKTPENVLRRGAYYTAKTIEEQTTKPLADIYTTFKAVQAKPAQEAKPQDIFQSKGKATAPSEFIDSRIYSPKNAQQEQDMIRAAVGLPAVKDIKPPVPLEVYQSKGTAPSQYIDTKVFTPRKESQITKEELTQIREGVLGYAYKGAPIAGTVAGTLIVGEATGRLWGSIGKQKQTSEVIAFKSREPETLAIEDKNIKFSGGYNALVETKYPESLIYRPPTLREVPVNVEMGGQFKKTKFDLQANAVVGQEGINIYQVQGKSNIIGNKVFGTIEDVKGNRLVEKGISKVKTDINIYPVGVTQKSLMLEGNKGLKNTIMSDVAYGSETEFISVGKASETIDNIVYNVQSQDSYLSKQAGKGNLKIQTVELQGQKLGNMKVGTKELVRGKGESITADIEGQFGKLESKASTYDKSYLENFKPIVQAPQEMKAMKPRVFVKESSTAQEMMTKEYVSSAPTKIAQAQAARQAGQFTALTEVKRFVMNRPSIAELEFPAIMPPGLSAGQAPTINIQKDYLKNAGQSLKNMPSSVQGYNSKLVTGTALMQEQKQSNITDQGMATGIMTGLTQAQGQKQIINLAQGMMVDIGLTQDQQQRQEQKQSQQQQQIQDQMQKTAQDLMPRPSQVFPSFKPIIEPVLVRPPPIIYNQPLIEQERKKKKKPFLKSGFGLLLKKGGKFVRQSSAPYAEETTAFRVGTVAALQKGVLGFKLKREESDVFAEPRRNYKPVPLKSFFGKFKKSGEDTYLKKRFKM